MGVRLVTFQNDEPSIAIVFTQVEPGTPGKARGWHGECTECGKKVHYWNEARAMAAGQEHVDSHI